MKPSFTLVLSWFFILNAIVSTITIILERKRPEKTIAWLLIFIFFPPIGLILYIFLGRNWKKNKLFEEFSPYVQDLINRVKNRIEDPEYAHLIELIANNSNSPLFIYNDITIFKDGAEKFKALKEELQKAKHHIHLEYYIVKSDGIGNEIKDILVRKAAAGVKVRFIMDRVGAIKASRSYIRELKAAGVEVIEYSYFLAPLLRFINTQINYRNHKKIVVIDGKTGFIGGNNIADEYLGKGRLGYWRDTHIRVKGDFVLGLQGVFIDDFCAIKKANEGRAVFDRDFDRYFPIPDKFESRAMQLITSGPDSEYPAIMHAILKMITMAKHHICISTPYFVPTESIMEALKVAALGGVEIKILFPGQYDHFTVYYASRSYLAELLKFGAKVYFYKANSFLHSKVMTVDGKIATMGTANMDIRSFELNYEINAVVYSEEITRRLEEMFDMDLLESKPVTLQDYDNTPRHIKIMEAVSRIFSSLL